MSLLQGAKLIRDINTSAGGSLNTGNNRILNAVSGVSNGFDISPFVDLFEKAVNASSAQNAFQVAQNQKAMDFNAYQAELNRLFQQSSAREAMAFSADQARINREFQQSSAREAMAFEREMADTAYQRAVKDMKAAGLNPILAYVQGGASSGHGFMGSGSSASGVSASGSSASGVTSSGSKPSLESLIGSILQYTASQTANSAKMLSAIGSIIPG